MQIRRAFKEFMCINVHIIENGKIAFYPSQTVSPITFILFYAAKNGKGIKIIPI